MTDAEQNLLNRMDSTIAEAIKSPCIPHMLRNDLLCILGFDSAELALLHQVECRDCHGDGGSKNGICGTCHGMGTVNSHRIVPVEPTKIMLSAGDEARSSYGKYVLMIKASAPDTPNGESP